MIIRKAEESDIPRVILLLKASLGESLLPKSEAYWKWKHVDNPFGDSPVLLAEEDGNCIGVRAFMRWKWNKQGETFEAVRAVDTATHPDYQGKGVFSKLTTTLLNVCKDKQWQFVFNTPNEKSLPGYLKMGWRKAGNLPLEIQIIRPLSMIKDRLMVSHKPLLDENKASLSFYFDHPGLNDLLQQHRKLHSAVFQTPYSPQYLRWRYLENPVAKYYAAGYEDGSALTALLIFRVKATKWGSEFRITDLFLSSIKDIKKLRQLINENIRRHRAHFVTFAANDFRLLQGVLRFNTKRLGPIVTVRDILPGQSDDFVNFNRWTPSLGDMELF